MSVDAIPAELRERPQWVMWRYEERDSKKTKVPFRCDGGGRASTTDPTTWSTFEAAVAALEAGGYDGIGFVFSSEDPYVGADLDAFGPTELAIVSALDSYTERSVSGRGAHVIVRAQLNGSRNRSGPLEIYGAGRYFAMTGDHVHGTPTTIEDRQAQLEDVRAEFLPPPVAPPSPSPQPVDLDDQELLEKAFAAKNGADVQALYEGQWENRYDSQSEAELALCSHLAFWTGRNAARIDALFRSSGLVRPKWERADYRQRTIEAAINATAETYTPPAAPSQTQAAEVAADGVHLEPVDWAALAAAGIPQLEYLAEPFLPARKRIWGVGAAESGKSIWAAWKSAKLTHAELNVVYISQENGLEEEARRFLRLQPDFPRLQLYVDQGLDLVIAEHRAALFVISAGADLVVLDTLTACWSGDEDSNADLAAFDRDVMKPLTQAGASVLILDHTGNPQPNVRRRGVSAPRGASTKGQKTDFLLEFKSTGDGSFRVERGKKRGTHGKEPRSYQVVDADDGTLDLAESEPVDERELANEIAELLENGEWCTANKLRAPKDKGGVGADLDAIKDALADDRFEHTDGPAIGKRKGSTYYRLREAPTHDPDAS